MSAGWSVSRRLGARVGGVMAVASIGVFAVGRLGGPATLAHVDRWSDVSILVLAVIGVAVTAQRARHDGGWMWLWPVALTGLGVAQLLLVLDAATWLGTTITGSDVASLSFYAISIAAVWLHLRALPRWTRWGHITESVVIASALVFIFWELVLLPAHGDVGSMSLATQVLTVLYPALDIFVASTTLLLLFVAWSPARVAFFCAFVAFAAADLAASASANYPTRGTLAIAAPGWSIGVALVVVALCLPGGARLTENRPRLSRLVLANGLIAASLWLATLRYVVHHHPPTVVTVVLGMSTGAVALASRLCDYQQASAWASQLRSNIGELQRAQSELRALLDDLPEAVVVLDRHGRIREMNRLAVTLTGGNAEQLLGTYLLDLFDTDQHDKLRDLWVQVQTKSQMPAPTLQMRLADGSTLLLEADANLPLADPNHVVVALRDVTQRVLEARRLERARERFRLAFHNAPTGMALSTASDGILVDVNESLANILGHSREALLGRAERDVTHPDDWTVHEHTLRAAMSEQRDSFRMEKRYLRTDGSLVWARTWVSVLDDGEGGTFVLSHVEDVTEQRHSEERLEYAATHDGLTGLPNRFRFLERLGGYLTDAEPGSIAVLFIDLDNFKVINDSLGHDAGDQLLRSMSQRLRHVVRDRDLLGRFGGDEFIVMLRDVSGAHDPLEIADRLRCEIARPVDIDGAELYVTASIGVTVNDRAGVTTGDMLRDADAAMYRAKARGRDCTELYSPGSHDASVLTLRTTNELRRGLERGEIVPYYQPIVRLGDGQLRGFEVLARWRHPDRGLLGPDQFLPMAEETGLIGDVGAAVLRASLAQLGQWSAHSPRISDLTVSVNVSVRQLMSSQLVDVVSDALAEAGVPAGSLWLEITETALMADVKAATVALRQLRSLGLHLAVDDFGTGYSSLTYLKRFPVESIKVDRAFVNGLGIDNEDTTIVEAVVKLGHSLGLSVVAEGVETPLQLTRLREIGCDNGQGYLFGRPRPGELIAAEYSLVP